MILRGFSSRLSKCLRSLQITRMSNQQNKPPTDQPPQDKPTPTSQTTDKSTATKHTVLAQKEHFENLKQKRAQYKQALLKQHYKSAIKYGRQVSAIQIPITVQTEESKLIELIEERRKIIKENNKSTEIPSEFISALGCFLLPVALGSIGMVWIEASQNFAYLSYLNYCIVNFNLLNIATISGIDLACTVSSHCLSINTVKTSAQNWLRLVVAVAPIICCSAVVHADLYSMNSLKYFAACYIFNSLTSVLYKDEAPVWLFKAKFRLIAISLLFLAIYYLFASSKNPEDLLRRESSWTKIQQIKEEESLRLSEVK